MASRGKKASAKTKGNEVDEFMQKLDHPLKAELEAVRALILGADASIAKGIKWNAPSFRTTEYFATLNLRGKLVQVIMHFGAKFKDNSTDGITIDDPGKLLAWLAKERASVTFVDMKAIKANRAAFQEIVRRWIALMP